MTASANKNMDSRPSICARHIAQVDSHKSTMCPRFSRIELVHSVCTKVMCSVDCEKSGRKPEVCHGKVADISALKVVYT